MIGDSKAVETSNDVVYSDSRLFRAVRTHELASWVEQPELCWQAQYYDSGSWERGSYYRTPQDAIEAAKRGKDTADMLNSMFG